MDFNIEIYENPDLSSEISDISFNENFTTLAKEQAIEYGLKNRKELTIAKRDIDIRKKEYKSSYIKLFPDIKLDFSYSKYGIFNLSSNKTDNYSLVFSFSFPFGLSNYSKLTEYYSQKDYLIISQKELIKKELEIKKEIISSLLELEYAKKRYDVAKSNSDISKNNLEIITQKYSEGNTSIIDLIEAQKDFLDSQLELSNSYYDLFIAIISYKISIGEKIWDEKY